MKRKQPTARETVESALRGTPVEKAPGAFVSGLHIVQALRAAQSRGEFGAYGDSSPQEVIDQVKAANPSSMALPQAVIRRLVASV